MRELITETQAGQIVLGLCAAITLVSLIFGLTRGARVPAEGRKLFWAQVVLGALVGPVLWAFWKVYNSIENAYGLDSLKALKINFFIALGIGVLFFVLFALAPRFFAGTRDSRSGK